MNKVICLKCGSEISGEFGVTPSGCPICGEAAAASSNVAPKFKKRLIYAALFFALLSLPLLCLGGLYWFVVHQSEESNGYSIGLTDRIRLKPTPRVKKPASISASEITRIEYTDSKYQKPEYNMGYLSNYAMKNYFNRVSTVSFDDDGRATKYFLQQETVNGVGTPQRQERHTGAFAPVRFAELAGVFVENDFLGEEESNTSTVSPVNQKLTVFYSSQRSKSFQAGNSATDTPEAEAMLKAFKEFENKIDWQRVE